MFEKLEGFCLAVLAIFTRIAVATESIAKSLDGAQLRPGPAPVTDKPAPAAAAAPAPPVAPAAPVEVDDLGLGDAPAAAKITKEDVLKLARDKAAEKGRDFVKEALKTCGYGNVKEIKEADYQKVVDALNK